MPVPVQARGGGKPARMHDNINDEIEVEEADDNMLDAPPLAGGRGRRHGSINVPDVLCAAATATNERIVSIGSRVIEFYRVRMSTRKARLLMSQKFYCNRTRPRDRIGLDCKLIEKN